MKCPGTKAGRAEITGKQVFLSPLPSPRAGFHRAEGICQGQVLPVSLPLELQTHPHVGLEEVALERPLDFPMLDGSQKGQPFLSGLLATKGNVLCQALVP